MSDVSCHERVRLAERMVTLRLDGRWGRRLLWDPFPLYHRIVIYYPAREFDTSWPVRAGAAISAREHTRRR